jgi:hypothetical protein
MMRNKNFKSRGKVCRLMNKGQEDEYKSVFKDNEDTYILEIVMVLVCL